MRILHVLVLSMVALLVTGCGTVGHSAAGIENFDRVSETVFRGAQPTERGVQTLAAMHVKTVINLRDGDDTSEAKWVRDAGLNYVHVPLDAETVTVADAEHVLSLIEDAPGPVFIHCLVGRDRTGMAVAAYRLRVQGWTVKEAISDLDAHGHFWLFFPKVHEAIAALGKSVPPKEMAAVVAPAALPVALRN